MMKITACILQILLQIGTCAMVKHYNSTTGRTIMCESVKCQGALEFCKIDYSRDICKPCPRGTYMVDMIDSQLYETDRSIFKCVSNIHWACPPEAEMVYGKITDTNQPPCECDRSRGYYGPDFMNCYLLDKPCGPGLELSKRGNCVPCFPGYFKGSNNFDLCAPKINCSEFNRYTINPGSPTSDAVCGPVMPSSTGKGGHHFFDIEKSTIDVQSGSYHSKTEDQHFDLFSKRNIFLFIILIPAVILIIVVPAAIGYCIKHRYSIRIKCCMEINRGNGRNPHGIALRDRDCREVNLAKVDDVDVEGQYSRRASENSITRITVHVQAENNQNEADIIIDNSEMSAARCCRSGHDTI